MGKLVAITQSNYIPWKGYFDLINLADELVLLDDVQYTRRDWRNRNRVKGPNGLHWLTIPVESKGRYEQRICDVRVSSRDWCRRHWRILANFYARAACFDEYAGFLRDLYLSCEEERLSRINHHFLRAICDLLAIRTPFRWSSEFESPDDRNGRLLAICRQLGATGFLTGPAARDYLRVDDFESEGIEVVWMDYSGYPEYPQLRPPFEHAVSIVDLILNQGSSASRYMKSFAG